MMESDIPEAIHLGAEAAINVAECMAAIDAHCDALMPMESAAVAERQQAEGVSALKRISGHPPRRVSIAHAVPA